MQIDSRIPLAGVSPDIGRSMAQGLETGRLANTVRQENALTQLYQEQGPAIMAGDPNALNALAGFSPMAGLGVQEARLGMDSTRQVMRVREEDLRLAYADTKTRAMEAAAQMSAEQRAAEAAKLERGLSALAGAQSPEQWDAFAAANQPELVGQFENREMLFAQALGLKAALDRQTKAGPEWAPASPDIAAQYGAQAGQINMRTGEFKRTPMDQGMTLETGPDGAMRLVQGPGVGQPAAPKFTEGQSKDNVYLTRAEGALAKLDQYGNALVSRSQRMLDYDPTGVARGALQTDEFQLGKQAGEEYLQAILRKDTGAAITAQEQDLYGQTYLPQPGDRPAVLEAKRQARTRAVEAIRAGMNIDQITVTERALVSAAQRISQGEGEQQPAAPQGPASAAPAVRLRYNPQTGALE